MKKLLLVLCLVTTNCIAQDFEKVPGADTLMVKGIIFYDGVNGGADTVSHGLGHDNSVVELHSWNVLQLGSASSSVNGEIILFGTSGTGTSPIIHSFGGADSTITVNYPIAGDGGTEVVAANAPLSVDSQTGVMSLDTTTVMTGTAYGMSLKKGIGDSLTYLTGDATTTSTSATRVSGLTITMAANEKWAFHAVLKIGSSSVAGCKYAVDVPPAASMYVTFFGTTIAAGTYTTEWITTDATLSSTAFDVAGITTAAVGAFLTIDGIIVNDENAGNFEIMHAKVTSGTATIYAGSYLQAWKQN
jgi:hypothetical protein